MTKFSGQHEGYKEVAQDIYILILNISHSNFIELEYRNITFDRINHIFYEDLCGERVWEFIGHKQYNDKP